MPKSRRQALTRAVKDDVRRHMQGGGVMGASFDVANQHGNGRTASFISGITLEETRHGGSGVGNLAGGVVWWNARSDW